jgi:hypothetical protein
MDIKTLDALIPESVKEAVRANRSQKVAHVVTGLEDMSFASIARHLGEKVASRRAKWRPVANGLMALRNLRSE